MALCPNCRTLVAITAAGCAKCGADFGPHSAWRPVPQSPAEQEELPKLRPQPAAASATPKPSAAVTLVVMLVLELIGLLPWGVVSALSGMGFDAGFSWKVVFIMAPFWAYPLLLLICAPVAAMIAPAVVSGGWLVLLLTFASLYTKM